MPIQNHPFFSDEFAIHVLWLAKSSPRYGSFDFHHSLPFLSRVACLNVVLFGRYFFIFQDARMPSKRVVMVTACCKASASTKGGTMPDSYSESNAENARLAKLVADGEIPFPRDLSPEIETKLVESVRSLQRKTSVSYIARQIALAIHDKRLERGNET